MAATFAGLFAVLFVASVTGYLLHRRHPDSATVANLNARLRAWWVMITIGAGVVALGRWGVIAFFAAISAAALREFIRPVPSRWAKCTCAAGWAVQYGALAGGAETVFWLAAPLSALATRNPSGAAGLMLCVYGLGHAPAILLRSDRIPLVFFVVLIVQASDVLQYVWGKWLGRTPVAPRISPAKTVEGLAGGLLSAALLGAALSYLTPFPPLAAGAFALALAGAGFVSGLVFSAVKRRRGIKDWGGLIAGHGGVLDRVDSLCLSAPLAYWVIWGRWG